MVVAVVLPSLESKSATNRDIDEASLYFPEEEDLGTEVADISIVLVYNSDHHYAGTCDLKKNFKDGIDNLTEMLKQCRILGDNLSSKVEDSMVKKVISKVSESCMNFHYELDKMLQTALEVNLEEALEPSKKKSRRESGSPGPSGGGRKKRLNREGASKFTTLTCHCGVTKKKQEDLDDHVKRRHANNHWHCVFENCPTNFKSVFNYSLKKHVQNKHYKEFYFHCKYCHYGTDEEHLLANHNGNVHKLGVSLPCINLGCQKMFNSSVSRDRHMKYCGVKKTLHCPHCKRVYKRECNLKKHMDLIHEKKGDLYLCKLCQHSYQSSTTYRAHYKNNQCYPTEDAPKDIVEDDNEEEEQQQQGQQQQEQQQVLVAGAPLAGPIPMEDS